ncbi:MAG: heavy-metal-associated domain-containing protein [Flavobacteriales bacterium]
MKKIQLFLILTFTVLSISLSAQKVKYQKTNFLVSGNCEMCKTKIESAAKSVEGVNRKMKVKFNPEITSIDQIQKAIATIGYDTEKFRADDEVYDKLHYCCKYQREEKK